MKRLIVLILASLIAITGFAAVSDNGVANHNSAFRLGGRNATYQQVDFTLPEFDVLTESAGNTMYSRILLPQAGTLMEQGMPELPVISATIAIPARGKVNIEVISSQQRTISGFLPYPLQQGSELESPKSFQINSDFYSGGSSYPESVIQYGDPVILRDFRIITVQINPFSYNAQTGDLTVYENVRFRLNFDPAPGINELPVEPQNISPSFAKLYESLILNYADYRSAVIANTPPRYLFIYGNSTDQNYLNAINEFALWKRQKGADVLLASTASAEAGSSTSTITSYIQTKYNNPATRPDYVILIGDVQGSYPIPAFTTDSGGTDYNYTFLAGTDTLGDCFIGRISVTNLSQLLVVLSKTYLYERDINLATADWLNRLLLSGDNSPSGVSTMYIHKYIKEMSLLTNPNYTFTEDYGASPNYNVINQAINNGVGIYSFRGYIDWVPPTESSLFNGYKLCHAVNITCATNNYATGDGEVEAFVRYGTTAVPKGAVTGIGMSTSSTHTTFNNVVHGGIFAGLYAHHMRTMGEALLHGRLYINQIFGVSSPANANKFAAWCNLMGDPTMEVFMGIPNHFGVSSESSIPLGLSLYDVAVVDSLGNPVEGAAVVLNLGSTILARSYTGPDGNAILVLPSTMTVGNATLTVSMHDFKPSQTTIAIVDTPTLVPASIAIDDDNSGASSGDSNGLAGSAETLEVLFGLTNTGTATMNGISGTITSSSPYISIASPAVTYPSIPGGQIGFNTNPVVITVAPNTPHGTMLRLHLNLTDSSAENYHVSEFIPVEAPDVDYLSYLVIDTNNQHLDPGETANLSITLKNNGTMGVTDLQSRLFSLNDLVGVTDHSAVIGNIPAGSQVSNGADNYTLHARSEVLPGMLIPMRLRLYNDAGYEQFIDFSLTIGVVTSTDPLGPDAYGYVIYDWTDTGYANVAIYDWHGISPSEGGLGTPVAITDGYTSSDEGDQVGADPLQVVSLPFPFQFYGILYDQITICSNGFIAMGVSENAEFRNYRLPGAMGPSPMIAPFWDDLATVAGSGIYTWFDRSNHSFVIEWNNLRNGKNGTSVETFQCILYDQAAYPTSFGDGPIKFQYHTFNNVDSQSGVNHGNFATIGIEDHTGTRGLEYSFNNQYPTAAAQLSSGKAIFITNVPVYHEAAHLLVEATYVNDTNGNSVCEPGETVELGVKVQNTGNLVADNVVGVLSTSSSFVTINTASSAYYPIEPGLSGVNQTPYSITVSPNCPDGEVLGFTLNITSGENSWSRQFSLQVSASTLKYISHIIDDHLSNFNGVIDTGESFKLIINLQNDAAVDASSIQATLSSSLSQLVIQNPIITLDKISPNDILQLQYSLDAASVPQSTTQIPLLFTATSSNGSSASANIGLLYNNPNVAQDFELNNGSFVSETGWAWGTPTQGGVTPPSGNKVWTTGLSGNYPTLVQYHLYTPQYILNSNSVMKFKHLYAFENNYDGANVSISTNGGNTWTIIQPASGYNGSNLNGLGGEVGWTGTTSGSWLNPTFNLAEYSGQTVMFRFRFGSDGANGNIGWFIDDFELSGVNLKNGYLHGLVFPSSGQDPSLARVSSAQRYTTHPNSDGQFMLFLPNGTHSVTASLEHHQSSTLNNIHINPTTPTQYTEFTLIDLPKPQSIDFTVDNQTGEFVLNWQAPEDTVLPVMGYKVYRKFNTDQFSLVMDTAGTQYSETFALQGVYKYYITVKYLNVDGSPSDIINVPFPYVSIPQEEIPGLVTKLENNYPNPFNPTTTIAFSLAKPGKTSLVIYNLKGQLVKRLVNGELNAGIHKIVWNGKDSSERSVASGMYLYRLESGEYRATRKMLLMK